MDFCVHGHSLLWFYAFPVLIFCRGCVSKINTRLVGGRFCRFFKEDGRKTTGRGKATSWSQFSKHRKEEVEKKRKRRAKQILVSSRGDFLNQVEKHFWRAARAERSAHWKLRNDKVNSFLLFGNRTKINEKSPLFGGPYRNSHQQFFYSPIRRAWSICTTLHLQVKSFFKIHSSGAQINGCAPGTTVDLNVYLKV